MPEQRDGYQPGQCTMHRPLANTFGILPGGLNYLDNCVSSSRKQDDEASICSQSIKASSPRVRQMDIPEVVDVNPDDMSEQIPKDEEMPPPSYDSIQIEP